MRIYVDKDRTSGEGTDAVVLTGRLSIESLKIDAAPQWIGSFLYIVRAYQLEGFEANWKGSLGYHNKRSSYRDEVWSKARNYLPDERLSWRTI
jgi:hypothetical protein